MKIEFGKCNFNEFGNFKTVWIDINTEKGRGLICVDELNECPEDATFNRELSFVLDIPRLLKMAYEAGKDGEEIAIDNIEKRGRNKK